MNTPTYETIEREHPFGAPIAEQRSACRPFSLRCVTVPSIVLSLSFSSPTFARSSLPTFPSLHRRSLEETRAPHFAAAPLPPPLALLPLHHRCRVSCAPNDPCRALSSLGPSIGVSPPSTPRVRFAGIASGSPLGSSDGVAPRGRFFEAGNPRERSIPLLDGMSVLLSFGMW